MGNPVARAFAITGDAWTQLIMREAFYGVRRFGVWRERLGTLVRAHGNVQLITAGHLHRPIVGALGGAPVVVAPSSSHQLELDLRARAPLAVRLEPPKVGLYRWTPEDGLACHFSHVQAYPGPFVI